MLGRIRTEAEFHKILLLLIAFVDDIIIIIIPVVSTTIPTIAIVTTSRYKITKIVSVLFLDRFLHSFNQLSPAIATATNAAICVTLMLISLK